MDTHESRVRRIVNRSGLVVGALLLSVLAACGAGDGGSGDESATPTSSTVPTTAPESTEESPMPEETTPYLDPSLGDSSKPSSAQSTISGTVESGVEAGCLVLEHEGTVYGIYGSFDTAVVFAGASVTLHGKIENDMMTTCQQGTPFVVEEAEAAG
jgi:hypothetical protein